MKTSNALVLTAAAAVLCACGSVAELPLSATVGPSPQLEPPRQSLIPTVEVASVAGWPPDAHPTPGPGLAVARFADGLQHPRWLYVLPNGDVLVAETNAPPKPEDGKGIKGFVMKSLMKKAGAGQPSADRITLLRDADGDGIAETRTVLLRDVESPFGMALVGNDLYVAATDALLRFRYEPGTTSISAPPARVVDLPAGPLNHHWTKNVIASRDGSKLYVTVGSNSNVGENGSTRKRAARRSGRSTQEPARTGSSRRVCAIRTAWRGSRAAVRCGRPSTSATSSAATSYPIT